MRHMTTRAVAFLATANPDASRRFYVDVLGLKLVEEHEFAVVFDAFGTPLRLQKVGAVVVAPYTAFGLEVDALETALDRLVAHGVQPRRYPHFEQDARGIWTAPSGARVCWFEDPDGNLLSLSEQPD
jgi:catechol 2,3-dioxygenase-like lactoylglutathione lyase family enzyme